ncbi:MAG TPA: hypothetical protein VGK32_08470 [Vicinamibacterales bacterium]|jgi:hypothetical protein
MSLQSITGVEDNEISRIAQSLKLEHGDLVRARLACKEYLRALQQPGQPTLANH